MRKWDSVYRNRKENFTDWKKIKKICVNGQRRAGNAERNAGHV